MAGPGGDMQWCFSQVKGAIDDDVAEGKRGKLIDIPAQELQEDFS
uniref:Uncharacterized protein n=1 Tax=Amphilophus citrinellus TaxID=61819 RepID=A0A3Q0QXV4_AMPCI